MAELPHVVILGAGFGGIGAAQKLRDAPVRITIVDKHDYHTFQPLLYQVATDELGPTEVGYPVRELLHRHKDWAFHKCAVQSVDLAKKQVVVDGMAPLGVRLSRAWRWVRSSIFTAHPAPPSIPIRSTR